LSSAQLETTTKEMKTLGKRCEKAEINLQKLVNSAEKDFQKRYRLQVGGDFGKMLTRNMVEKVLDRSSKKWWNDEDMSKAISIYNCSSTCYEFLREQHHFPFPSRSTVLERLSKITVGRGIIQPVMKLISHEFSTFSPMQRTGILCFDEVHIDGRLSFDEKNDIILGPFKNMMGISIRGLYYSWKQLIYVDFDDRLTREKILHIIHHLSEVGVNVVGMVSDMSTINRRLWNELFIDVNNGQFSFKHPNTKEPIWLFADFPHLIKLLRNHLLDHNISLGPDFNNTIISVDTLKDLLNLQTKSDLRLTFKLTEKHLNMNKRERMDVRTAMELFSNTTSAAIKFLLPEHDDMANFFKLVNDATDILNTRTKECGADHPYNCPYGNHLAEQDKILEKFVKNMMELRVLNSRPSLLPFQKGFKLTCGSIKGLLQDMMKPPVSCRYVMGNHVNQDHLESLFGAFRGIGRYNDLPMPLDALSRVKKLIVAGTFRCPKTGNVHAENGETFLSSRRLSIMTSEKVEKIPLTFDMGFYRSKFGEIDLNDVPVVQWENISSKKKSSLGGAEFVAGYLARRLVNEQPTLSSLNGLTGGWISAISRGGLVTPSQTWLTTFLMFEKFFEAFHRSRFRNKWDVNSDPEVTSRLRIYLARAFPDIPLNIIQFYVKLRTKIRVEAINKKIVNIRKKKRAHEFLATILGDTDMEDNGFDSDEDEECSRALDEYEVLIENNGIESETDEEELLDV
jgi:hypothetical protein